MNRKLSLIILLAAFVVNAPKTASSETTDGSNQSAAPSPQSTGGDAQLTTTDQLKQRGKQLRADIDKTYDELVHTKKIKGADRVDESALVAKYIPVGTPFKEAEAILKAADFDLMTSPPRPEQPDNPHYDRFSIRGGYTIVAAIVQDAEFSIRLTPDVPGASNANVKKVNGVIFTNGW